MAIAPYITGVGVISSLGQDIKDLGVKQAKMTAVGAFDHTEIAATPFYQGVLANEQVTDGFALAKTAALAALDDAGLCPKQVPISLVLATGAGDTWALEHGVGDSARPYDLAYELADALGLSGVVMTVATACSSSSYAVSLARDLLTQGAGYVLVCGVEPKSCTSQYTFKSLMALDSAGCFPFSAKRNGTVLGAGAAALVLSEKPSPMNSDYARLLGIGLTCDGYHDTAPEPDGRAVMRGMEAALEEGGYQPQEIDLFVPHATGTRLNDEIEQRLLDTLFSTSKSRARLVLLKGDIGHTCGASSAFSMVVAAKALRDGQANAALINASAFGGNNSAVLLGTTTVNREVSV